MRSTDKAAFHPGHVLLEELKTRRMSPERLALGVGEPLDRIMELIAGRGAISPELAFKLGFFFGVSARLWVNAQVNCEKNHDVEPFPLASRVGFGYFPL